MARSKAELTQLLDDLEARMPEILRKHEGSGDVMAAFGSEVTPIESTAGEHAEFVRTRVNCILGEFGLIPSDNEGESCSD
jgi:hypothetical protein